MSEKTEEMRKTIKSIHEQVKNLKKCSQCLKRYTVIEYDYCADCLDSYQFEPFKKEEN